MPLKSAAYYEHLIIQYLYIINELKLTILPHTKVYSFAGLAAIAWVK